MAITEPTTDPSAARTLACKMQDYYTLTKPEVNLLILMTTSAGYYLGSHGPLGVTTLINTEAGTLLVASGTATLNQFMERRYDAQMRRTAGRPAASGRLSALEALCFGLSLSVAGGMYLALVVNRLASLLAVSTLLTYLLVYTPLKRKTPLCTALGAIPGAMPTLIGWAGASGRIDARAWVLFAILFLWQFPHFLAIALLYRDDYARAKFRMLPQFDLDGRFTKIEIAVFTMALVVATMLAGRGNALQLLGMTIVGLFFLYHSAKLALSDASILARSNSSMLARRVVNASVIYLPIVLGIMIASRP